MAAFENPLTFVRTIKGAPSSVLWALLFTRRAMTSQELQRWTGYHGEVITDAVRLLLDLGWLTARSARGPWGLADGQQFPLVAEPDLIGLAPSTATTTTYVEKQTPQAAVVVDSPPEPDLIGFKANHAMCIRVGIGEPKATSVAKLPWATPEFIQAHVDDLRVDDGERIGMAIRRIESNELPASLGRRGQKHPAPEAKEEISATGSGRPR